MFRLAAGENIVSPCNGYRVLSLIADWMFSGMIMPAKNRQRAARKIVERREHARGDVLREPALLGQRQQRGEVAQRVVVLPEFGPRAGAPEDMPGLEIVGMLRQHGALDIYAGVSHSVLTDLAVERLKDSDLKELISTNSVPLRLAPGSKITALSVAGLLGEGIRRIHDDESVSSLFEVKKPK